MNRGAAGLGGGRLQFMGSQRDMAERLSAPVHTHTHTHTHTHSQQSAFHCAAVFYIRRQGIEAMDQGTSNIFS